MKLDYSTDVVFSLEFQYCMKQKDRDDANNK